MTEKKLSWTSADWQETPDDCPDEFAGLPEQTMRQAEFVRFWVAGQRSPVAGQRPLASVGQNETVVVSPGTSVEHYEHFGRPYGGGYGIDRRAPVCI